MTRRSEGEALSTASTDPRRHSPITSQNRLASLKFALDGCIYMLRQQKNTRILLAASLTVAPVAAWLGLNADQLAILTLAIAGVWVAEFINGAIEAAVNLAVSELHPMAKAAKDVAAAAVLIAAFTAFLVGLLLLGPPIIDRLSVSAATS